MEHGLTMTEDDFPGDNYPFGVDLVVLIEWFSVVQFFGRPRVTSSHACYASLASHFGNRHHRFRKVDPKPGDAN